MDQQPVDLEQIVAAARASGIRGPSFKLQPSWPELELDGHLSRLKWGALVYLVVFAAFWLNAILNLSAPIQVWQASLGALILSYAYMSLSAYFVQAKLNEKGLSDSGAWQVWVGALVLNPAFIGGYVSFSVLLRTQGLKRRLGKGVANSPSQLTIDQ